jgi:hypothetical protein
MTPQAAGCAGRRTLPQRHPLGARMSVDALREGADPLSLIAAAAQRGIDIAGLPAVAARLR